MLVEIEFTTTAPKREIIDLVDYGFEAETSWDELNSNEQDAILDSICEQYDVIAGGENMSYENNQSLYEDSYDGEDLKLIINKQQ